MIIFKETMLTLVYVVVLLVAFDSAYGEDSSSDLATLKQQIQLLTGSVSTLQKELRNIRAETVTKCISGEIEDVNIHMGALEGTDYYREATVLFPSSFDDIPELSVALMGFSVGQTVFAIGDINPFHMLHVYVQSVTQHTITVRFKVIQGSYVYHARASYMACA